MFTHFYSDPHFSHANIIDFAKRPYRNKHDMDADLIDKFNSTVPKDGFTLFLGDCSWDHEYLKYILTLLNGRKALVRGNHDKSKRAMAELSFDFVVDELEMNLGGTPVCVSHYPPKHAVYKGRQYDKKFVPLMPQRGNSKYLYLHGHTHEFERCPKGQRRVHIGVDAWGYKPVSVEEIIALIPKAVSK